MRVSPRPIVSAATGLALTAGMLAGVAVEVAQAPPAAAAVSPAGTPLPYNDYCGPNATYGRVAYNYYSGEITCIIELQWNSNGSWTKPSLLTNFLVILLGGGGGGRGTVNSQSSGGYGQNGAFETIQSQSTDTGLTYVSGQKGDGSTSGGSGGDGTATYVAMVPGGRNNTTSTVTAGKGGTSLGDVPGPADNCPSGRPVWQSTYDQTTYGNGGCGRMNTTGLEGRIGAVFISHYASFPTPPSGVSAVNGNTPGNATVSWTASTSDWAKQYEVTATSSDDTETCLARPASPSAAPPNQCNLTDLTIGDTYTVTVTAQSALGGANAGSQATLASFQVTGAPQNTGVPTISGSAALTTPTAQVLTGFPGNWEDFGFTIDDSEYRWERSARDDSTVWEQQPASDDTTSLQYTVTEDDVGRYLRLTVRLKNQFGWSDPTSSDPSLQVTTQPVFTDDSPSGLSLIHI